MKPPPSLVFPSRSVSFLSCAVMPFTQIRWPLPHAVNLSPCPSYSCSVAHLLLTIDRILSASCGVPSTVFPNIPMMFLFPAITNHAWSLAAFPPTLQSHSGNISSRPFNLTPCLPNQCRTSGADYHGSPLLVGPYRSIRVPSSASPTPGTPWAPANKNNI